MKKLWILIIWLTVFKVFAADIVTQINTTLKSYMLLEELDGDSLSLLETTAKKSEDFGIQAAEIGNFLALSTSENLQINENNSNNFQYFISSITNAVSKNYEDRGVIDKYIGEARLVLSEYRTQIEHPLSAFSFFFAQLEIDNATSLKPYIQNFSKLCQDVDAAADKLFTMVFKNCQLLKNEVFEIYAKAIITMDDVEYTIKDKKQDFFNYDVFVLKKHDYVNKLVHLSRDDAFQRLNDLTKDLQSPYVDFVVIVQRFDVVINLDLADNCIVQKAYEAFDHHKKELFMLVNLIRKNLVTSHLYAGLCANITFAGQYHDIYKYLDKRYEIVRLSSLHLNKWITLTLYDGWPELLVAYAKKAIGHNIIESDEDYERTGNKIIRELALRSAPGMLWHVTISEPWTTTEWYHYRCSENCVVITSYNGINVFIHYFMSEAWSGIKKASEWFKKNKQTMTKAIADDWKTNSLPETLKKINKVVNGSLLDNSYFSAILMLHNSKVDSTKCIIKSYTTTSYYQIYQTLEYFNPNTGKIGDAERFKIYLYI